MKELLLEHRGFICTARLYEDGRWGFGNGPQPMADPDSPFDFFWFARTEEEARRMFAISIDKMIERRKRGDTQKAWESGTDCKSVTAVMNIQPDVFEERLRSGQFDRRLLLAVEGGDYVVPLQYVTKAWDRLLKGTLGVMSFLIGPEEDEDFSEEELRQFLQDEHASRSRGEAIVQNDRMKEIWKEYLDIDIDSLDVDFRSFDMHLPPNVSRDEYREYFLDPMEGLVEWILPGIIHKSEGCVSYDIVSCLMELTAHIIEETK